MEEKICLVSTARAPKHQINQWINYHLNIGLDKIFLFLDNVEKADYNGLKNYDRQVRLFFCDSEHYKKLNSSILAPIEDRQRANANYALEISRKERFNWICHLDIDELIYFKKDLKQSLRNLSRRYDYLRLPALEAIPERTDYKSASIEVKVFRNNFWKFSKKSFKSHIAGKSIVRTSSPIRCMGIHQPTPNKGKDLHWTVPILIGRILHYNCCGFEDWKNRWSWRLEGSASAPEGGEKYKEYVTQFNYRKISGRKSLENFYKDSFFLSPPKKKIYSLLGIILRIKLTPQLFKRSKYSK